MNWVVSSAWRLAQSGCLLQSTARIHAALKAKSGALAAPPPSQQLTARHVGSELQVAGRQVANAV